MKKMTPILQEAQAATPDDSVLAGDGGAPARPSRTELRSLAQSALRDRTEHPSGKREVDSPEVLKRALHELQVHQLELELRNEELQRTQAALDVERTRYVELYDRAPVGYGTVSEEGQILQLNLAAAVMLALPRDELLGQPLTRFIHPDDQDGFYLLHRQLPRNGDTPSADLRIVQAGGKALWVNLTVRKVRDADGAVQSWIVLSDISKIRALAFYDPLTGLPNRRLFMDRLEQALALGLRHLRKGALLFVDLDNFKAVNDTLGHHHGDLLLEEVARRLSTCVREGDTVARLGGDEFLVMLENLSEDTLDAASQAEAAGEKIRATLAQPYRLDDTEQHITASIGITLFGGDPQELAAGPMKRADMAMYQAKLAGRNTLRFFDPEMQAVVSARAALESGLREALKQSQFVLHYQPQVDADHRLYGAEALVRWVHPQLGLVEPAEFIPIAEETGLIQPLGQWVLETACAQLAQWARRPETERLTISVNVSARQFRQEGFVARVLEALKRSGANAQRLTLELTESLLASKIDDVVVAMKALKAEGVGLSLDDFGTGLSSLAYLKRLPLDQLKIDRSFVRDMLSDPGDAAISKVVIALAENFGMSILAEGVETLAQEHRLAAMGCHRFQGLLFSRPLGIEEFEVFATRQ